MAHHVLVIDDSKVVRSQVRLALEGVGCEVSEAADGSDGLARLRELADLAVAICDVNMPGMNGIEMLEALKAEGIHPKLPIIMLTTEGQPELIQRAKRAGARGWIVKPFKPEQLSAAVIMLANTASR